MIKEKQIYRCSICGNIVEVLFAGGGTLVCCGKPMELQEEKKEGEGQEKHLPIIEKTEDGVKVKVGEVLHPMESDHYIEWIELVINGNSYKKFLKPGEKPEAEFKTNSEGEVFVREYCNIHGLWRRNLK